MKQPYNSALWTGREDKLKKQYIVFKIIVEMELIKGATNVKSTDPRA